MDNDPHSIAEQRTITDGRIVPVGKGFVRKPSKKVDYQSREGQRLAGGRFSSAVMRVSCLVSNVSIRSKC
jgi:hypothetical protein